MEEKSNGLDSYTSVVAEGARPATPTWLKLGAVAFVSAIAGGVAAAWWYRKTLSRLHQAAEETENPDFGMANQKPGDEG